MLSLYGDSKAVWSPRLVLSERLSLPLSRRVSLLVDLGYWRQCTAQQVLLGGGFEVGIMKDTRLSVTVQTRLRDALIVRTALRHKNVAAGLSYDATNSDLSGAVRGVGALELGLQLFFDAPKIDLSEPMAITPPVVRDSLGVPVVMPTHRLAKANMNPLDNKDSDGDGIVDRIDRCPYEFGLAIYQGCNDRDKDGVADPDDACPLLAGSPENHGCPLQDMDSDGDGVVDRLDKCMYLKGLPSMQGCPDTDGDGISDINDDCPYMKGTAARNGCPERQSVADRPYWDNAPMLEPTRNTRPAPRVVSRQFFNTDSYLVEFDTDKYNIRPTYIEQLDALATWITQHPAITIVIAGHTDAEGDALYNKTLSQRRAEAVRNYLYRKGAPTDNVRLQSYGESSPKSTNVSAEGRQRNRRSEIYLISEGNAD
jgi:outer membrane protein OmpA-like peptidoglycan-associated protein